MSDKFYAVEFRSMHTAKHNVAVFSLESIAFQFLMTIEERETMPEHFPELNNPKIYVDMFEIDYRNIPRECEGIELEYVNTLDYKGNHEVPDVYNY